MLAIELHRHHCDSGRLENCAPTGRLNARQLNLLKELIESSLDSGGLTLEAMASGLAVVAFYMQRSVTTIDERGLRQTWIAKREVAWDDIQFAKFVPLLLSKRLVVFTRRGRPLVFQGSTQALHIAFAKISLVYRSRK